MGRLLLIPLALLLMVGAAVLWSGGAVERRADFTFANRIDVITLDPNYISYIQDIRLGLALWEGLYTYDPVTMDPVPGCASRVDLSQDQRVYTFHIRPETRWSNGDLVTAGDFIFAWRRALESPGEYTYLIQKIKGARAYSKAFAQGEGPDFAGVGMEAVDANLLRVTLEEPVSFFLDLVAFPPFFPQHRKSMEKFRRVDGMGRATYDQRFTRPPDVVTNGPFMLAKWEFKKRIRLEASPHYWDRANVKSRTVELVVVEDLLTQFLRYEAGAVDFVPEVSADIGPELLARGRTDLHNFEGFGTQFLVLNCKERLNDGRENPLADVRVRQALALAIDKRPIVENVTRLGEKPATTYIPPGIFKGWRSTPGWGHDVARARKLLAEAGYPEGRGFGPVTYLVRSDIPMNVNLAQVVCGQLKANLNLDCALEGAEMKTFRRRLNNTDFEIAPGQWIGDYGDPSTFTDKFSEDSENNDAKWMNREYGDLLRRAAGETDSEARLRLLEKAERILNEQAPIIPLFHLMNQYLFRENVIGINLHPRNMTMLKAAGTR